MNHPQFFTQANPYGVVFLSKKSGQLVIERYPNARERDIAYAVLLGTHENVTKVEPGESWVAETPTRPVTQAEINRQDIRERDDFASIWPVSPAFHAETNYRRELQDWLRDGGELPDRYPDPELSRKAAALAAAAEAPTVTREDGAKLSALGFWIGKDGETLETARTQHTPGPWVAVGVEIHDMAASFDEHGARVGDTPNRIARVEYPYGEVDYRHGATKEANARLIAAAPELADALAVALSAIENLDFSVWERCNHDSVAYRKIAGAPSLAEAASTLRAALVKAGRS